MKKIVYSFDVFDTSLVRIWARPTHLFWEVGYQLQKEELIQISPESWSHHRIEAERTARETVSSNEVTLEEIYEQLTPSLNWSKSEVEKAIQKEIEIELLSLRPVPVTQRKIQSLQQADQRVIFISDMYLSEEVIRNFLKESKVWTSNSTLYVSSEVKVHKVSGKLFHHCLAEERLKPSQLYHVGDNLYSDVKVPRKLGISSESLTQAHLNRYEEKIADTTRLPLKFRSLLAGASRLTRLQSQQTSHDKQVIWNTTASAIAPLLFGFVYWCLVEAQKKGIQRLYFVARDGQILQKIAQVICQKWGYAIECRYLYGSRKAWHMPAIQEIGEFELDWMLGGTKLLSQLVSIRSMCERVNISPEQIKDVLERYGFPPAKWDLNLQQHERDLLRQIFTEKEITKLIISTAASYREKVIGYFRQEGLDDGTSFGFVDIGWGGNIQRSFSKLLSIAGLYPESGVCGFYFGLQQRKPFQNDSLLAYFYDVDKPSLERALICKYRCLFELFVAADHGSTTSYEQCGEQYIPVLRSPKNEQAIDWGLHVLQRAVVEFTEQITTNLSAQECTSNLFLEATEILTKELIFNPSPQEAEVFGSFVMSGDMTENAFYVLAPVYSLSDWWRRLLHGQAPHEDVWFPGTVARSNAMVRLLLGPGKITMIRKFKKIPDKLKRKFPAKVFKTT
jgi:predicted HAD superfamily hydrolase